ncbi:ABC transporter substrate-binding protein [Natronosporangium hydrolyticum]|uniref:ABC transporter substrate-binding protein n=1 Tax=Natronosporangium hydrolyticum TaxID=2811111 RepID=A0A895YIP7_9ACTN|nr:ABC transporter substrate-binding protein [Natronosporangium hydrolyticum]QSB15875.1 ABC transporter substrate-binding protein [Natronosporangium hydrolyticum]
MPARSRSLAPVLAIAALTLGAACSATADPDPAVTADSELTVEDWTGATITLPAPAERVVCLDGTCIDALTELGLPPVVSLQLDQVQHPDFFGPDVATEPLDGTFFEPSLEGIVAAEPDLVIGAATVHGQLREALAPIPFFAVSLPDGEAAVENLNRIATLTGRAGEAETAIDRYRDTLAAYQPGVRETEVLAMYGGATDDIGIDALDSAIGRLLAEYTSYPWPEAGEADGGFLELGLEDILAVDPAHIFVLDFGFDPSAPPLVEQLADRPVWGSLAAVEAGNVHVVDDRWWGTTGGTRGQQLYLDVVLPTVYPEEFPEPLGIAAS